MFLLFYVHVCVTRTGWKTRPRPETVILPIEKSINQSGGRKIQQQQSAKTTGRGCLKECDGLTDQDTIRRMRFTTQWLTAVRAKSFKATFIRRKWSRERQELEVVVGD